MLGDRIKNLRKRYNLTQKELAKKLNISEQALALYEQNRRKPNPEMLKEIANIFEVSTDYLLNNEFQNIEVNEKNKKLAQSIIDGLSDPLQKALYSKASELKNDRDREAVLKVIEAFIDKVDNEDK